MGTERSSFAWLQYLGKPFTVRFSHFGEMTDGTPAHARGGGATARPGMCRVCVTSAWSHMITSLTHSRYSTDTLLHDYVMATCGNVMVDLRSCTDGVLSRPWLRPNAAHPLRACNARATHSWPHASCCCRRVDDGKVGAPLGANATRASAQSRHRSNAHACRLTCRPVAPLPCSTTQQCRNCTTTAHA